MSEEVYFMLERSVQDGALDKFKALMQDMVASTKNEPDTLNYEWTISEDGRTCHIYERYKDSAAMTAHLGIFGVKFANRFMAAVKPTRLVVYGAPDRQAKDALAALKPTYMAVLGGFKR